MSIKSEKFPDDFEEMFKRLDSTDRDKKDVAFSIWCELEKLEAENKALKESRNELLDFLKRVDQENWLDGDWWEDIIPLIEKTEALKEKESK